MCDSVHIALCSPMFAKSLPVQLLSLQIKRQLRKGVSPVQSELGECCLEPPPTKPSPKSGTSHAGPAGPAGEQRGSHPGWGAAPVPRGHTVETVQHQLLPVCPQLPFPPLLGWRRRKILPDSAVDGACGSSANNHRRCPQKSQYRTGTSHPSEDTGVPAHTSRRLTCQLRVMHQSCKFILP